MQNVEVWLAVVHGQVLDRTELGVRGFMSCCAQGVSAAWFVGLCSHPPRFTWKKMLVSLTA